MAELRRGGTAEVVLPHLHTSKNFFLTPVCSADLLTTHLHTHEIFRTKKFFLPDTWCRHGAEPVLDGLKVSVAALFVQLTEYQSDTLVYLCRFRHNFPTSVSFSTQIFGRFGYRLYIRCINTQNGSKNTSTLQNLRESHGDTQDWSQSEVN